MYYTIYEIKNLINGKVYVGCHMTTNLNDGYMGSGLLISDAIAKYGINNFEKRVLHYCNSIDEMYALEREVVNEEFISRSDTYNLRVGGRGYRPSTSARELMSLNAPATKSDSHKKSLSESLLKTYESSPELRQLRSEQAKSRKGEKRSEEARKRMSDRKKEYWASKRTSV